mgnify:CR=1 FL=1
MTDLPLTIRHETPADNPVIEKLHDRAFGPGRYAKTAYRLREGIDPIPSLSFVALVGTLVVGSIRLTPVVIGGAPALLLGPLAVEDAFSSIGIGMRLVQKSVETAKAEGCTEAQGFLFAKAMPEREVADFFTRHASAAAVAA